MTVMEKDVDLGATLTELVMIQMRRSEVMDLSGLDRFERRYLGAMLARLNENSVPLGEWNRIGRIILGSAPKYSSAEAKASLVAALEG